jgi:hypothetical protein
VLVASVAVAPAVCAYVVGVCFSLDLGVVRDTYQVLPASVAYGLIITLSVGSLMLALSSLTRRSFYVGITWVGLWIISASVAAAMIGMHQQTARRAAQEADLAHWLAEHPPPPGVRMNGLYPTIESNTGMRQHRRGVGAGPGKQATDVSRWHRAWSEAMGRSYEKGQAAAEAAGLRDDWRPLCSYVANLERIGDVLFDTDTAWVRIGRAVEQSRAMLALGQALMATAPEPQQLAMPNERRFADLWVPQYPWAWSAWVLAGLLALSLGTLGFRVRTLDRLK